MTTLNEILNIEGIVIRKIPMETISLYNYNEYNKRLLGLPDTQLVWCPNRGKEMIKETRRNTMGGKYLIKMEKNQDGLVRFNKKTCGIGDTIEEAYKNFLSINSL